MPRSPVPWLLPLLTLALCTPATPQDRRGLTLSGPPR